YSSKTDNVKTPETIPKKGPKKLIIDEKGAKLPNGGIFHVRPIKVHLEKDKTYKWCLCGRSKSQPFCDGRHILGYLKHGLRPITVKVEKTGEYLMCTCKQTKNRPFCDGIHTQPHIQAAVK
ncbi:CDGSH iron-sulfur domain-containing protein 3, mitochondrial, partial [Drosophila willistoni]|uniref:CDGSH iron-sulfur domain-containing protein 3, mitochondrial n=1 Tax=Drosophila willistoni TaxID=7260 RepID=UPI000C26D281